jgi:serine/threonine protein kinase/tetratricopeptide (TPR) repeat protein
MSSYYELAEPLGEGGFGSVFRAVHRPTGLPVAIKLLRRADPDSLRMLLVEATAVAKVRHPNVAQLLDVGRTPEGIGFLVMELVRGHDFELWLSAWPGWPKVARALVEALDGLSAAHAAGVVHRDLKPPNLLLDERDGSLRLVDFGIATILDPIEEMGESAIAGTPEFMAPEQIAGGRNIGPWTDLYAFGVLLHHVVRGSSPFDDALPLPLLLQAKETYVPSERPLARPGLRVPPGLDALIEALLAPDPRARPRFAAAVRDELVTLASQVEDDTDRRAVHLQPMPSTPPEAVSAATLVVGSDFVTTHPSLPPAGPGPAGGATTPAALPPSRPALHGAPNAIPHTRATDSLEPTTPERRSSLPAFSRIPASLDPRLGTSLVRLRDLPLVARDEERALLGRLVDEVRRTSDVRVLLLLGEPGIGKSRLARWGLSEVERRGLMQSTAVGYELEGIGIGGGIGHLLARLVGVPDAADAHRHQWLLARDPSVDLQRLRALVAPTHATLPSRAQVVDLAQRVLRAASRDAPLYVWIDDLGWARDGAIEVVQALVREGDVPILIVATVRASTAEHTVVKERLSAITSHPRTTQCSLAPLDLDARRLLASRVAPLSQELADQVAAGVDGSPLSIVQLVHDWLEAGYLVPSPEGLVLREGHGFAQVLEERPPTQAVDARVERVLSSFGPRGADAEGVLVRAALLGASFDEATLLAACEGMEARSLVPEVLDRALLAGLLRAEDGSPRSELGFEHGMVQANLSARLDARADQRAVLFDTANGLQASFGKDRADVAYAVAVLLRRAGRLDPAWDRVFHAIDRASWVGDVATAMGYVEVAQGWDAADAGKGEPSRRAPLAFATARTHYMASRYDEAQRCVEGARALALADGAEALVIRSDALAADIAYYEGRYAAARALAEQVLLAARPSEDPDIAAVGSTACHRLSELAALEGDLLAAHGFRRECLDLSVRSGMASRERLATLGIAEIALILGRTEEAARGLEAARRAAVAAGDVDHQDAILEVEAFGQLLEGDPTKARPAFEGRLRAVQALGEAWRITGLRIGLALASALSDDAQKTSHEVVLMLEAFDAVPHDGPIERHALSRLESILRGRSLFGLADACAARIEARARLAKERLDPARESTPGA